MPIRSAQIRRPFTIVPGLTVAFDSKLEIILIADLGKPRTGSGASATNQTLRNPGRHGQLEAAGALEVEPRAQVPFTLKARGREDGWCSSL